MIKKQFIAGLLSLIALQTLVQGEDDTCCDPPLYPIEPATCDQIPAIFPYPASVRFECKTDIYVSADFIYWRAYSNAPELGFLNKADGGTRQLNLKEHYRPGFEVGAGIDLGDLVADIKYIRWHHSYKTRYTAGLGESITPWSFSDQVVGIVFIPGYARLDSQWKYHFDQLLFTLQRPIYIGTNLVLAAGVGVIADWVKEDTLIQGINEVFGPAPGVNGFVKGNFTRWTVGPAAVLYTKALLPCGFRLIGNLELNLTYAEWKGKAQLAFPPVNPANPFANSIEKYAHPVDYWKAGAATQLGIGWESYLWCDSIHVYLGATYDVIATWSLGVPAFDHVLRFDPSLHGWTLEGRFDF